MKKLERSEMKKIKGGIGCQCENPGGEGPIVSETYDPVWARQCAAVVGGHWCCASCSSASWAVQP